MPTNFLSGNCPWFNEQRERPGSSLDRPGFDASGTITYPLFGVQHKQAIKLFIIVVAESVMMSSQTQASKDIINFGADLTRKIDAINAARGVSGVTLTTPAAGNIATIDAPPVITYTNTTATTKYQLLVSKSAMFPNGSTVNKLVDTAVVTSLRGIFGLRWWAMPTVQVRGLK